jgi:hypothetical protein
MKTQTVSATKSINAPAADIYRIIADYHNLHPLILPKPYFLWLKVQEGGVGDGTLIQFKMRILGQTQTFRARISEPLPGRELIETDLISGAVTKFTISALGNQPGTQVNISTELRGRNALETLFAKPILRKIYTRELELLARLAQEQSTPA